MNKYLKQIAEKWNVDINDLNSRADGRVEKDCELGGKDA